MHHLEKHFFKCKIIEDDFIGKYLMLSEQTRLEISKKTGNISADMGKTLVSLLSKKILNSHLIKLKEKASNRQWNNIEVNYQY